MLLWFRTESPASETFFAGLPSEASDNSAGQVMCPPPGAKRIEMADGPTTEPGLTLEVRQLATLLDSAQELIALLAADGTIHFANETFRTLLGYAPDELIGRNIQAVVHGADTGHAHLQLKEVASRAGSRISERCRFRCRDGSWRWIQLSCQNRLEEAGLERIFLHGEDVTELHRMESERQVISDIVHALNQTSNLDQLLSRIHHALKRILPAENCFVALYDPERESFQFPFFVDEYDTAPPPQKIGRSCTAYVFRTGRANLIPQSEFDRLVELGEVELVGSPAPSWLGVPLKTPLATIGVLVVQHYQNENAYSRRDLEFLDSVGGHIALAIDRRRAEEELRNNESTLRLLFEANPIPTWLYDLETLKILRINDAAVQQYGYSHDEFRNMTILDLRPASERENTLRHVRENGGSGEKHGTWIDQAKDGRKFEVEFISHELCYADKRVRLVVAQDISERKHLENQLRQSQKMEAIGRLAGGVAHDFNNLLMVIKGHTELLLNVLSPGDQITRKIQQIDHSADRAAALTRQLLAFSRMQVLQPQAMNLNSVVEEMGKLLPRLIGEDVELVIRAAGDLGTIRADASQMEQVIMNLAVNARDAMPNGGKLLIETSNVELQESGQSSHPLMKAGRYIQLVVSDTGTGMDAVTQAHIFEPFFTTKGKGKGTGLGLATVYGIIKQSGGFIWVYSELGKGTSFKIYLPHVDQAEPSSAPLRITTTEVPTGTETVLLAEDEQDVREIAKQFLESGGYQVIEAKDGNDAMQIAGQYPRDIHLLVTDMVMPGMTGQDLAVRLQHARPGLCVVFMSGYSEHAATELANADPSVRLLSKPFSRAAILRAARQVLSTRS